MIIFNKKVRIIIKRYYYICGGFTLKTNIRAEVIRNESFDPYFVVKVSYNDGINKFFDEVVSVERKPPKVTVKYPESIKNN